MNKRLEFDFHKPKRNSWRVWVSRGKRSLRGEFSFLRSNSLNILLIDRVCDEGTEYGLTIALWRLFFISVKFCGLPFNGTPEREIGIRYHDGTAYLHLWSNPNEYITPRSFRWRLPLVSR